MENREKQIKDSISGRIISEHDKHPNLDWQYIAASKIYSSNINPLLEEIERLKQTGLEAIKISEDLSYLKKKYEARVEQLQSDIKRFKSIQSQETTRANELQDEVERVKRCGDVNRSVVMRS